MERTRSDTSTFGGRLKYWREARSHTQETLAEQSGVAAEQLSRYENNRKRPSPRVMGRLADALSIPIVALTIGADAHQIEKDLTVTEFRDAESMRTDPVVYEFLAKEVRSVEPIYPYPREMMARDVCGIRVPIPMSVMAKGQRICLGSLSLEPYRSRSASAGEYVQKRRIASERFFNNLTYTLRSISCSGNDCTIDGGLTDYVTVLNAHNALEHELLLAAHRLKKADKLSVRELGQHLPMRKNFLKLTAAERRRASTLGLSTLIVYSTEDGYKLRIRKRGTGTAVHPNLLHVVPACGFAPEVDAKREWNIEYCLIKEYCEELFDRDFPSTQENPDWIFSNWGEATRLQRALASGAAEILFAGLGFHLMSFRSDICCVLLIHEKRWFETQMVKPDWEYLGPADLLRQYGPGLTELRLESIEEQFLGLTSLSPLHVTPGAAATGMWDPAGLAALWLGVDCVRRHLGGR